jgi:hypothetical protein
VGLNLSACECAGGGLKLSNRFILSRFGMFFQCREYGWLVRFIGMLLLFYMLIVMILYVLGWVGSASLLAYKFFATP